MNDPARSKLPVTQALNQTYSDSDRPRDTEPPAGPAGQHVELPWRMGRYTLLKLLGAGGMGAVYLAHDEQLDRKVALKIPTFVAAEREDLQERFLREARAAAALSHPNICPVFD